jgi:hypothetical protein
LNKIGGGSKKDIDPPTVVKADRKVFKVQRFEGYRSRRCSKFKGSKDTDLPTVVKAGKKVFKVQRFEGYRSTDQPSE